MGADAGRLEFPERFVVGPFGGGRVAGELVEDVVVLAHGAEQAGVGVIGGGGVREDLLHGEGFEATDPLEFPAGLDHLIDEEGLVFALGGVLGAQTGGEVVEVLPGFVGQDIELAAETMTGRVLTAGGFSFRARRTGGEGGILPVSDDLGWCTHLSTFTVAGGSKESASGVGLGFQV